MLALLVRFLNPFHMGPLRSGKVRARRDGGSVTAEFQGGEETYRVDRSLTERLGLNHTPGSEIETGALRFHYQGTGFQGKPAGWLVFVSDGELMAEAEENRKRQEKFEAELQASREATQERKRKAKEANMALFGGLPLLPAEILQARLLTGGFSQKDLYGGGSKYRPKTSDGVRRGTRVHAAVTADLSIGRIQRGKGDLLCGQKYKFDLSMDGGMEGSLGVVNCPKCKEMMDKFKQGKDT